MILLLYSLQKLYSFNQIYQENCAYGRLFQKTHIDLFKNMLFCCSSIAYGFTPHSPRHRLGQASALAPPPLPNNHPSVLPHNIRRKKQLKNQQNKKIILVIYLRGFSYFARMVCDCHLQPEKNNCRCFNSKTLNHFKVVFCLNKQINNIL